MKENQSTFNSDAELLKMIKRKGYNHELKVSENGMFLVDSQSGLMFSAFELQLLKKFKFHMSEKYARGGMVYLLATTTGLIGFLVQYFYNNSNWLWQL